MTKLNELPSTTTINDGDIVLVQQGGADKQINKGDLFTVSSSTGTQTVAGALDERIIKKQTVATMKASSNLAVGNVVQTNSYSGNGGGHLYEIKSTGTADGGQVIALDNGLFAHALFVTQPTVELWGAKGDGTATPGSGTDDTLAIQAMVAAKGYFTLSPEKYYRVTDSIEVPANEKAIGSIWSGGGMESSYLIADSMLTKPVIKQSTSNQLIRLIMRDFAILGDCKEAMAFRNAGGQIFQTKFENLVLRSKAGDCFYADEHFSTSWYNVHVGSVDGHGFNIEGGNSTVLINCYAHDLTVGNLKAGYRIRKGATLIACNGLDSGDTWGIFGSSTTAGDATNEVYRMVFIGCNLEDFSIRGCEFRFLGTVSFDNTTFLAKSSGTYEYEINFIDNNSHTLVANGLYFDSKGATRNKPQPIITQGRIGAFIQNKARASYLTNYYDEIAALTYRTHLISESLPSFQVSAMDLGIVTYDRSYGFTTQVPNVWTPDASTFDVTGLTKVKTANTVATNFDAASGGIDGQELYILIQDANTTIRHAAAGAGRFENVSGANIAAADGDVYHYVSNKNVWQQIA